MNLNSWTIMGSDKVKIEKYKIKFVLKYISNRLLVSSVQLKNKILKKIMHTMKIKV